MLLTVLCGWSRRALFGIAMMCAIGGIAQAQNNTEIQVYGAETVAAGRTMLELHSNFTDRGRAVTADGVEPTLHAMHETVEITHGFTPWFEIGFYTFTTIQPSGGLEYVGNHIRPRFRVPESCGLPVGLSLSQEVGYARSNFSADTWSWEIRPIVDQTLGRFYWAVNPALERSLQGPGISKGRVRASREDRLRRYPARHSLIRILRRPRRHQAL